MLVTAKDEDGEQVLQRLKGRVIGDGSNANISWGHIETSQATAVQNMGYTIDKCLTIA